MTKTRILVWVIAWILQIILVGVMLPSDFLQKQIENERRMMADWMGLPAVNKLVTLSNESFDNNFVNTGIVAASYRIVPSKDEIARSGGIEDLGGQTWSYVEGRLELFWLTVYQAIQRIKTLALWFPYLLPLMIPAVIHGMCVRAIKKVSYGYASPVLYHSAGHALALVLMLPLFYVTSPISIHPIAIFFWGVAVSITIVVMTSNVQKQI
ncbi:DUF4400 domain-containing protein [Marinobacter sp. P4B1]|uniref:DUF4400 domain-containing protein n=1 Tax=Marinobacter sp. P4B1 TaxID=1119533 RepID=UPI00071DC65A|nr:DUF4400 domain-containing protein [Marinobacter sp. P4B1]KRW83734.1 hypothetical protein AQ621_16935 [Marinobacter sp. P4B1]